MPFDPNDYDCTTSVSDLPRPTNLEPTATLAYGSMVDVGGFTMKVTSAGPGTDNTAWNGTGQITIPWLGVRVNCLFRNLYVNTDLEVYDGTVIAVDDGLSSLDGFQTVAQVRAGLETDPNPLNFSGDSVEGGESGSGAVEYNGSFYASGNPVYYNNYIPYDPNRPGTSVNQAMFYNEYNPKNHQYPYSPTDYTSTRNPYTEEKPFDPLNIWNPWNYFNPYDPEDYLDPANPWSATFEWTPDRMFAKQGIASSSTNTALSIGAINLPIAVGSAPNIMA